MNQIQGLENFFENQTHGNLISDVTDSGEGVAVKVLVMSVETREDKNGNDYCDLKLSDGVAIYPVKMWKTNADKCGFAQGNVINAIIAGNEYRGAISYTLTSFTLDVSADPQDFVIGPPIPIRDMWQWIEQRAQNMKAPYSALVKALVIDNKDKYATSSAARSNHHNFTGGLLYHSYRMARSADALAPIYNVDADVCVAGCLLHDIGKIRELDTDSIGNAEYTLEGQLEHHIPIGVRMVDEAAHRLNIDIEGEPMRRIRHMILSHHGEPEYSSPVRPATSEAILLHELDVMDMKLTVWQCETEGLEPGSFTPSMNMVTGSRLYLPKP